MREIGEQTRAAELAALVLARNEAGGFVVEDRAARSFVCLLGLALARADADVELPRFLMEQIGVFTRDAAAAAGVDPEALASGTPALERYLLAQLPGTLQQQVEHFFREQAALGGGNAKELAAALGIERSTGPLQSGARPVGTTAAGPFARFQLQTPDNKPTR